MAVEKTQLKFARSEKTGELIGFVSRHSKTRKLKGVREDSRFKKKICVLSEDLKGTISENFLYTVELKEMHLCNGFVVISATPVLFETEIETVIVKNAIYQVIVSFGNKVIYYDPKDGRSPSSKTLEGVLDVLRKRKDILNQEEVIEQFIKQCKDLLKEMRSDGYYFKTVQANGKDKTV